MSRMFMFFLMELGWKALIGFMVFFWATPFAGQTTIMVTIVMSGIVQVTYLLSEGRQEQPQQRPPRAKTEARKKEVKQ